MTRPVELSGGFYTLEVTQLHKDFMSGMEKDGHFYFTPDNLLKAFALAYTGAESQEALNLFLTFNKFIAKHKAQIHNVGFKKFNEEKVAFTYTVQSNRYQNDPLMVDEVFIPNVPMPTLLNETAKIWIQAYKSKPDVSIVRCLNGLND